MLRKHKDGPWREAYRPAGFDEFSPTTDVTALQKHVKNKRSRSQIYMFHGETGTGKTTMAYIVGKLINCLAPSENGPCNKCENCGRSQLMIEDRNIGDQTGVDATRELINRIQDAPLMNINRVIILDEAHALTPQAQKAWLKVLEDPKPWLYVIFCTTNPSKFLDDLRARCHQVPFRRLNESESVTLMMDLAKLENLDLTEDGAVKLFQKSGGRARHLINAVQTYASGGDVEASKEEQLKTKMKDLVDGILLGIITREAYDNLWNGFVALLTDNNDNAEGLRRMVLWWLWMYAENKKNWARKFRLTRVMNVMEIFSNPLGGEDQKYQFAVMMFRAWKHDSSNTGT